MRNTKETTVEPIPQGEIKAWNALIKETRQVVLARDTTTFDLIILAGKVEAKYGENRIGRWAEEACVGLAAAKQYRWLSSKGLDTAFIEKWCRSAKNTKGLSYSVIREIASFAGGLKSIYALEYLQYAYDHSVGVIGIRGYMLETTAPNNLKDEAAKSIKMALQDKQEHEGFSNALKYALENFAEEHPELEDEILSTVISSAADIEKLKIAAGIVTDDEGNVVNSSRNYVGKVKLYRKWLREHEDELIKSISMGHELSDELRDYIKYLAEIATRISKAPKPVMPPKSEDVPIPSRQRKAAKKAAAEKVEA